MTPLDPLTARFLRLRDARVPIPDDGWGQDEHDDGDGDVPAALDKELTAALRRCMESYGVDQRRRQGDSSTASAMASCNQRQQRPGIRSRHRRRRRRAALAATTGTWVTYYGRHMLTDTPWPQGRPRGKTEHGDVTACAVHCAFAKTQLVSREGVPDEALLVKRLEDSIAGPRERLGAMREAHACFVRLGAASNADDDLCVYTMKLARCMGMDVVREYNKIKSGSGGW
ncbi:hypothetical protein ONE63_007187 [Megalurothrips usitatus]|uniref:Uncharacterized protein n=1 Tax=Megalurothrips usitatus TaxID=439358 RepID=A0AAV7XVB7_9NEOP|nr:hypothetical protein ONE63_007187 [Megalurothrips usitatus]